MRLSSLALVASMLVVSCSDSAGPGTDGTLIVSAQVDGQTWSPDNGANTTAHLTPEGHFQLVAFRRDTSFRARDAIGLIVRNLAGPGRYLLTSDLGGDCGIYEVYGPPLISFVSTPPNAGVVEVTEIDTVNHRIAGRFQFDAQQSGGTRRVPVRTGVFRVEYQTTSP